MKREKTFVLEGVLTVFSMLLVLSLMVGYDKEVFSQTPAEGVRMIKVGATLPLNTSMGVETKKCLNIMVDLTNEAGGVVIEGKRYKFEFISYDDKYTADGGRAGGERLIYQDKVQFMVGTLASPAILPQLPLMEEKKIPFFNWSSTDKIIDPQWHYSFKGAFRGSFLFSDLDIWKNHPEVKTCVFFNPDHEAGWDLARVHKPIMEAIGIKVLPPAHFPGDTVDFSPFATKIVSMNPGVVRMTGSTAGAQFGLQLKALHAAGYKGLKSASIFTLNEVLPACGKEAIEGLVAEYPDPTERPDASKATLALKRAYEKKYGEWNCTGVSFASAWDLFLAAIKRANSLDPDRIVAAVEGMEYESTRGRVKMIRRPFKNDLRTCSGIETQYTIVVKDGKVVPLNRYTPEEILEFIKKFDIRW